MPEEVATASLPPVEAEDPNSDNKEPKPPLRSWRKKYRKLKFRFDKSMDESHVLFKNERRALALARRLQEDNHQVLDMLFDFEATGNTSSHVREVLKQLSQNTNVALEQNPSLDFNEAYLRTLLEMPHKAYEFEAISKKDDSNKITIMEAGFSDYLDPLYEEEYLASLDSQLIDDSFFTDMNKPLEKPRSRVLPSDKELHHMNADSVLSWLRRHHPETFLQEKDVQESKPEKRSRSSKKAKAEPKVASEVKVEPEIEDAEENGLVDEKQKGRSRKSAADDAPYRPKGGSSRGSKRKRNTEEGPDTKTPSRGKRAKQVEAS